MAFRTAVRVNVECGNCGIAVEKLLSAIPRARTHYCGLQCRFAHQHGAGNPKWRGGKRLHKCQQCGREFNAHRSPSTVRRGDRNKYCSRVCKVASHTIYDNPRDGPREQRRRREIRKKCGRAIECHTFQQWRGLLTLCGYACVKCGSQDRIERDHIIPLSRGGTDAIERELYT